MLSLKFINLRVSALAILYCLAFAASSALLESSVYAWSPPGSVPRKPGALPAPGGIYDAPSDVFCKFLLESGWCKGVAYGAKGEMECDADFPGERALGFYNANVKKYCETNRSGALVATRIHELGHLWQDICRQTIGETTPVIRHTEEVRNLHGHLANERRKGMCQDAGDIWNKNLDRYYADDKEMARCYGSAPFRSRNHWLNERGYKSLPLLGEPPTCVNADPMPCPTKLPLSGTVLGPCVPMFANIAEPLCNVAGLPEEIATGVGIAASVGGPAYEAYLMSGASSFGISFSEYVAATSCALAPPAAACAAVTFAGTGAYQCYKQSPSKGYCPSRGSWSTNYFDCFYDLYLDW